MFVIYIRNLVPSSNVLIRCKRFSVHPCFYNFHGNRTSDNFYPDTQDIGVVMLTGELRTERILTDTGVYAINFVCDHSAAIADTINKDTAVAFSTCNSERCRVHKIRQVASFFIISPEILYLVPLCFQLAFYFFFQMSSCVIICHSDSHNVPLSEQPFLTYVWTISELKSTTSV